MCIEQVIGLENALSARKAHFILQKCIFCTNNRIFFQKNAFALPPSVIAHMHSPGLRGHPRLGVRGARPQRARLPRARGSTDLGRHLRWMACPRGSLEGSFSAVSKLNFACKYAFESSRRDLHNALLCTALYHMFSFFNC